MITLGMRQYQYVSPPRAHGGGIGEVAVVPVSTTAAYLNLALLFQPTFDISTAQTQQLAGVTGNYVTLHADGADVGVIFGQTQALVTATNAPVIAAAGTVTTGTYAGAAGTCYVIKSGQIARFLVQATQDLFMGYVGSASANLRVYQSSPPNP